MAKDKSVTVTLPDGRDDVPLEEVIAEILQRLESVEYTAEDAQNMANDVERDLESLKENLRDV